MHIDTCIQLSVGGSAVGATVGAVVGAGVLEHELFPSEGSASPETEQ